MTFPKSLLSLLLHDNLEEVFENREQIEISRYYEKLPKPTLIATQEYVEGKIYYRNPAKEKEKLTVMIQRNSICLFVVVLSRWLWQFACL